jgi:hypothetical protein
MCNNIVFICPCELKNHLWAHKCAISFFSLLMLKKKSLLGSQVCNIIIFVCICEKKSLVSPQVCNINFFFTYVNKKNHLMAHKSRVEYQFLQHLSFFSSLVWIKKHLWTQKVCNIIFVFTYVNKRNHLWAHKCELSFLTILVSSSPIWIKKTICEPKSVKYHFLQFHIFFQLGE